MSDRIVIVCDCCTHENHVVANDPELERDFPRCRNCGWPMDKNITEATPNQHRTSNKGRAGRSHGRTAQVPQKR